MSDFVLCDISFKTKPIEVFPKKANVRRLFIFKINCTSIPGAFLARENLASQYHVKPHYTEQDCTLDLFTLAEFSEGKMKSFIWVW